MTIAQALLAELSDIQFSTEWNRDYFLNWED